MATRSEIVGMMALVPGLILTAKEFIEVAVTGQPIERVDTDVAIATGLVALGVLTIALPNFVREMQSRGNRGVGRHRRPRVKRD